MVVRQRSFYKGSEGVWGPNELLSLPIDNKDSRKRKEQNILMLAGGYHVGDVLIN